MVSTMARRILIFARRGDVDLGKGPGLVVLVFFLLGGGALSVAMGTDRNWDLRNYHVYGPYAWLRGRLFFDLAPAQVQSFFNPTLYIPHQALFFALQGAPRLFAFLMGLPAGLFGFIMLRIAWDHAAQIQGRGALAWASAAVAGALGLTGAAVLPGVGLSSFDVLVAVPLELAYWLVLRETLRRDAGQGLRLRPLVIAGATAGLAVGLKLTALPFAAAIGLMILALLGLRAAIAAGIAMAAGFLLGFGPFAWHLWQATGNPVFPLYNNVFRSPEWLPQHFADERFLPRSWLQGIFYPFWWLTTNSGLVTELRMRDPRMALCYLAWVVLAVVLITQRRFKGARALWLALGVSALSYAVWAGMFGIYRYIVFLEALAAVLIMLALILALPRRPILRLACFAALTAVAIPVTVHPNWGHGRHGARILDVEAMPVRPGDLVVSVDDAPMSYLVPLMPPDIRAIGLASNFVRPGQEHGVMRRIRSALEEHGDRAIWSIAERNTPSEDRDRVLAAYNLELGGSCIMLRSSFEPAGHQFCPVRKRG